MGANKVVEFKFPVGYQTFHKNQLYNFQMNRPYSFGYARSEDMDAAGPRIRTFADWKHEMLHLASEATEDERWINAAAYFRAAEFYTFPDDPDKERLYDRFSEVFYQAVHGYAFEKSTVPYGDGALPILCLEPSGKLKGVILFHGGYDSFIEEFFSMMAYFSAAGYMVVGFEGPGQGAARRKYSLPLDFRWEKPVAAVLDHLALDDVTLIGLSMGGYFALRAAAFEPRVKRVIASGHAYDYRKVAPAPAAWLLSFFRRRFPVFTNNQSRKKIRAGGMEAWNISHMLYVLDIDEPVAALDFAFQMNEENLHADLVTQDVLLLASTHDHFIPFRLHREQVKRLSAARSVSDRVFTKADHAQNHCQIGNTGLALDVMREWLDEKTALARQ